MASGDQLGDVDGADRLVEVMDSHHSVLHLGQKGKVCVYVSNLLCHCQFLIQLFANLLVLTLILTVLLNTVYQGVKVVALGVCVGV